MKMFSSIASLIIAVVSITTLEELGSTDWSNAQCPVLEIDYHCVVPLPSLEVNGPTISIP